MTILYERGYLIPAFNTHEVDYIKCAVELAHSIRYWHKDANIALLTDAEFSDAVFDVVTLLPFGDLSTDGAWKLSNDWQAFSASPFRQTIKLEADMIAAGPVDHWWTLFEHRDIVISQGARDFYDNDAQSRFYRKIFDNNALPDVYNAITYWRYSAVASEFFRMVRDVFENWSTYKTLLRFPDEYPTTDVVYGIAANIIGCEKVTLPKGYGPNIVHMKRHMIPTEGNDWSKELIWENTEQGLRLQTIAQHGFIHYHIKDWANEYRNDRELLAGI